MKESMSIIGLQVLNENTIEVSMVPAMKLKKNKPDLMELASGGLEGIQKAIMGDQNFKTVIPMKKEDVISMRLNIGSIVTLEVRL